MTNQIVIGNTLMAASSLEVVTINDEPDTNIQINVANMIVAPMYPNSIILSMYPLSTLKSDRVAAKPMPNPPPKNAADV